ncbi:MAG TPA: hypothetical protein VIK61_16820, partial [Acidimicrobiia bacterium]
MSQDSLPEMAGANAPVNHPEPTAAAVPQAVAAPVEPPSPEPARTEPDRTEPDRSEAVPSLATDDAGPAVDAAPVSENGNGSATPGAGPALGPDGLPRRRRRGSRGGRNRKRPGAAGVASGGAGGAGGAAD